MNEQYAVMGGGFLERIWSNRIDCPNGNPATHHTLKIEREGYDDCYRTDCVEVRYRFGWRKEKSAGAVYMGAC